MEELKKLDENAHAWFHDKPPQTWSRSHFTEAPKCDVLLNNCCESFNSDILEARDKPIITMLKWVREFFMKRLQENRIELIGNGREARQPKTNPFKDRVLQVEEIGLLL
ncbi:UNVERIFIED_CONTAM: hypothetical protein Sangu_2872100 [Sesamum angustifolium]|uniref:Uncharacterized protein n=1 Tax=Sesamum angustifolium TaxID=2727405 RepID=A0AAW2IPX4_9LAMI